MEVSVYHWCFVAEVVLEFGRLEERASTKKEVKVITGTLD